jgi:formylglycine-generating enzyme required for sulfatase activity
VALDKPVPDWPAPSEAQAAEAKRLGVPFTFEEPTTGLRFVLIPGGSFRMGSPESEAGRGDDEGPVHEVKVPAFYLAMFETTNEQFRKFKPDHASGTGLDGPTQPAVRVSHVDAEAFAAWPGKQGPAGEEGARAVYALPTEAQWEYACRAGTSTPFAFGDTLTEDQANFSGNAGTSLVVGRYAPNAWGLYDMHGNAWEWCRDRYDADAYAEPDEEEPPVADANPHTVGRVARGGGWGFPADGVRCAYRRRSEASYRGNAMGFRLVRSVVPH